MFLVILPTWCCGFGQKNRSPVCFWLKDKSSSVDQDPKHLTQLPCNIPNLHLSTFLFSSSRSSSFVVLKTQIIGISHHHRKLAAWSEDFNPVEIKGGEVGLGQIKSSKSPSLKPFLTSSFWNIIEKQWWREGMPPPGAHVRQEFYCWTSMYGLILMMIDDMISDNDCRLIIRVKMLWPIDAYSERTLRH